MKRLFAGAIAIASAAGIALTAPVAAGAATHPGALPGVRPMRNNPCPVARTVCAFTGESGTGTEGDIPVPEYHSQSYPFDQVVGFHPDSLFDNSGSDIWVLDRSTNQVACILGGHGGDFANGFQPGYFYIQYNVNTCSTAPPGY
jgi:hypothetical protein